MADIAPKYEDVAAAVEAASAALQRLHEARNALAGGTAVAAASAAGGVGDGEGGGACGGVEGVDMSAAWPSADAGVTAAGVTEAGVTGAGVTGAGVTEAGVTEADATAAGATAAGAAAAAAEAAAWQSENGAAAANSMGAGGATGLVAAALLLARCAAVHPASTSALLLQLPQWCAGTSAAASAQAVGGGRSRARSRARGRELQQAGGSEAKGAAELASSLGLPADSPPAPLAALELAAGQQLLLAVRALASAPPGVAAPQLPARPASASFVTSPSADASPARATAVAGKRGGAPGTLHCGVCKTCLQPSMKKACLANHECLEQGLDPLLVAGPSIASSPQ